MKQIRLDEKFEVFYDGDCPLCLKEITLLKRLDGNQRIVFTDIATSSFNAESATGVSYATLMGEIHGRYEDGTLITGVEVFRQLYGRVGFRWAMGVSRLYGVRHALDASYRFFAKNRLRFTGRCIDETCQMPLDAQNPNV